jgi:hypothetical protein
MKCGITINLAQVLVSVPFFSRDVRPKKLILKSFKTYNFLTMYVGYVTIYFIIV